MIQSNAMIRVIYAKLTSTGAYDVVAKTANIELNAARELAERVQPGNIPYDSKLTEAIAYLRPSEGGHLIARYAPYAWRDAHGRESILTDVVWVGDAVFASARNNPFVLIPRTDAVFDVLTELPPVAIPAVDATAERARLAELQRSTRGFHSFVAAVLSSDPLLIVDREPLSANLEALVLLLPPSLRTAVTFHTQAFQPVVFQPRVTIADAMHANLRSARWAKVLPDDAGTVLAQPAEQLIELLASPDRLAAAQDRFEQNGASTAGLSGDVARMVGLDQFAHALRRGLATDALRRVAAAPSSDAPSMISELQSTLGGEELTHALSALLEDQRDNEGVVAQLLNVLPPNHFATVADWAVQTGRPIGAPLAGALIKGLAVQPDADRVVRCFAAFSRVLRDAGFTLPPQTPDRLREYLQVQLERDRAANVDRAARLLLAAGRLYNDLKTPAAQQSLDQTVRYTLQDALRNLRIDIADVRGVQRLQALSDDLPQPLRNAVQLQDTDALTGNLPEEASAAIAASLIVNANLDAAARVQLVNAAARILKGCAVGTRERTARVLQQMGVTDVTLLDDAVAFDPVLSLLGYAGGDAALAHTLVSGLRKLLLQSPASSAELADVVLNSRLRANHSVLRAGSLSTRAVVDVFTAARQQMPTGYKQAIELALELLSLVADRTAMREIEAAALQNEAGIEIRLRRLDRAYAQCQTAAEEPVYRVIAAALERGSVSLPPDVANRLKDALGLAGFEYGLVRAITEVFEPRAV